MSLKEQITLILFLSHFSSLSVSWFQMYQPCDFDLNIATPQFSYLYRYDTTSEEKIMWDGECSGLGIAILIAILNIVAPGT